jgi:hypothetical protein
MYANVIDTDITPNIGGAGMDFGTIQLFSNPPVTGTWNLGSGIEANYATCEHCIVLYEDTGKVFFQQLGSMTITSLGANENMCAGSFSNVTVIEVTINPMTFTSTPVPGGACYTLVNGTWNTQ